MTERRAPGQLLRALRRRAALLCSVLLGSGVFAACGGTPPLAPQAPPKAKKRAAPQQQTLPALNARERELQGALRRDVAKFAGKIGERNVANKWELASAADELAEALSAEGLGIDRQGYDIDGEVVAQNLAVEVRGTRRADEIILVGAHYDSAPGSPGADDNASGVAAVLALARRFRGASPARTVRFVFFVNEEPPYFQTDRMGSLVYARAVAAKGETVLAMLSIESIGYYSDQPGSQKYPAAVRDRYPRTGNFLAVVANPKSKALLAQVTATLKAEASLPIVGDALPESMPGVGWSDHWSFWQIGVPAVMLTDTATFRNPHYHRPTDTPDRLDYGRMARAVYGIERVVIDLAGIKDAPSRPQATIRN